MGKIGRALISVHDKSGAVEFARGLAGLGVEILSTGGTARMLREAGLKVTDVSEVTGFPEMLEGRVKTLHPKVHAGILARRDKPEHLAQLKAQGIELIDLVVINLYPFEATVAKAGVTLDEAVEQIDVGGPTMIRAAAKNWRSVAVVMEPGQYSPVLDELKRSSGSLSDETRYGLAREAFRRTAQYDAAIATYLRESGTRASPRPTGEPGARTVVRPAPPQPELPAGTRASPRPTPAHHELPAVLRVEAEQAQALRYGENPHQIAAFYRLASGQKLGLGAARQLAGPELSYNNLLDFSAALSLLLEFDDPAAVAIKHTNPCGAAIAGSVGEAVGKAKASDPVSIYGGIVGVNRTLDMEVVKALSGVLIEILFAPAYDSAALEGLTRTKKKCRVLEVPCDRASLPEILWEYRSVLGGLLVQSTDQVDLDPASLKVVSRRPPTEREWAALRFAWKLAKHVKSNAIVLATPDQLIGAGAGQMNRVDSSRLAVMRARANGLETSGTVCASDAFFPFRDGLDVVAEAGATAVIHPGGSLRDDEVLAAADQHGMAMVLTGIRHFRH